MSGEAIYGTGADSSIGTQIRTDYYQKKALTDLVKERYFGNLADVTAMPKNMGKKIKRYHYLPLLDDRNINDQGIDAAGAVTLNSVTIEVRGVDAADVAGGGSAFYFVADGVDAAAALLAAQTKVNAWMEAAVAAGGLGLTLVGATEVLKYVDGTNSSDGLAYVLGYRFVANDAVNAGGNLYGSSKDVGTISGKLPTLTETGGRKNRVGFKRIEIEGTLSKFGFFDEYTQESLDFDSDAELLSHITEESLRGANEITEDALQIDILNAAGIVRFAGDAVATAELTGVTADTVSVILYEDLMKLGIDLDNNRTPKSTKMITGSRMVDTKTIDGARILYIGSELIPNMKRMVDLFSNQAFIPVRQYASAAGGTLPGEIGSIDQFRIVVVPEMMHWEGAGAAEGTNAGYRVTGGNYDVFPALVVGSGSFTTIGFQTDGKTVKFKIMHKKPGMDTMDSLDPYGEIGRFSIKWYYGFMALRPERIALLKAVAEW